MARGRAGTRGTRATARVSRGGRQRIGGQEVSWQYDPEVAVESKPQDLYPKLPIPCQCPMTGSERAQLEKYRSIKIRLRKGPLFTLLNAEPRKGRPAMASKSRSHPFTDSPSHSQRCQPQQRTAPLFNTRRYDLRYFPASLRYLFDPEKAASARRTIALKRRKRRKLAEIQEADEGREDGAVDQDDENDVDDDDIENDPDLQDATYSDEEGGDYNAEMYFDGGGEDIDDTAGDGGDGDYD